MAELKTKPTNVSVEGFLNSVEDEQQRADSFTILKMMQELTGDEPKMWGPAIVGFGSCHYEYASGHSGDMCRTGFSPRKAALTIYFCAGLDQRHAADLKRLGKAKTSKGCLYVKRLADIDLTVLRKMLTDNLTFLKAMQGDRLKQASMGRRKKQPAKKAKKVRKKS